MGESSRIRYVSPGDSDWEEACRQDELRCKEAESFDGFAVWSMWRKNACDEPDEDEGELGEERAPLSLTALWERLQGAVEVLLDGSLMPLPVLAFRASTGSTGTRSPVAPQWPFSWRREGAHVVFRFKESFVLACLLCGDEVVLIADAPSSKSEYPIEARLLVEDTAAPVPMWQFRKGTRWMLVRE